MMSKVLILAGGYSNEREISLITAKSVIRELKKIRKYKLLLIEPDGEFVKKLRKFKPDLVFNLLHGRYGEDGYIQSILESEKINYTHSGVLSSSLAIDKEISKKIFIKNNILTPPYIKFSFKNKLDIKKIKKKIDRKLRFPVVLKPINEGSSVGVYITDRKNFIKNLKKLEKFKEILIEKYIPGREIQAAILGSKKLGIIELKPKRRFYDYKAKYSASAKTEHIIPVNVNEKNYNKVNSIAMKAHKLLKCRGVSRSDFRFYKNKFYLLELNTQPGMTSLSLVPEIAKYQKIDFIQLIEEIMRDASVNK
ncbi:D-alanine--D-alanine ligase [Pelagibacterales bacterium SAG-MED23]|nr:D-alanine--D-alanine ligase [Pelagibacterales bacterium SAG-MED23]